MITIQKDILVIIDPKNPQDDVEISLDETIYPKAHDLIMAIKEMDFEKPEKAVYDVIRLRKVLWHLGIFLQDKLNMMSTRDPDYVTVEHEFGDMKKAASYVVGIVELLGTGYNVFENRIANPHSSAALN